MVTAMLTNNLFADFLIDDNRQTIYSMLAFDNRNAFIAFFSESISVQDGDQFSIAEIKAPLFGNNAKLQIEKRDFAAMPYEDSTAEFSPGGMVLLDMYNDTFVYSDNAGWALSKTIILLHGLEIRISTGNYDFKVILDAGETGFTKRAFCWSKH